MKSRGITFNFSYQSTAICRLWLMMNLFMILKINRKIALRQVEQDFSSFFAKYLAFLFIFQSFAAPPSCIMLHFEKSSNMSYIWQKYDEMPFIMYNFPETYSSMALPNTQVLSTLSVFAIFFCSCM